MAAPSAKQRATTLKRQGFDDSVIGAIFGVSPDDVRALLYEADPDVALILPPALHAIPFDPNNINLLVPQFADVESWEDLYRAVAPSDAPAYDFQVTVELRHRNDEVANNGDPYPYPLASVYATDAAGFADYWENSTPVPNAEVSFSSAGDAVTFGTLRTVLRLPVRPGQEIGFGKTSNGDSHVTFAEPVWIPFQYDA